MVSSAALVTCRRYPRLTPDDRLLIAPLKKLGISARPVIWDAININWKQFDIVILRSAWDYHLRLEEFLVWLNLLIKQEVNLWNPPSVIKWNIDKKYLFELEKKGIPVIPVILYRSQQLIRVMEEHNWQEIVIKPAVGASSHLVFRINKKIAEKFQSRLSALARTNQFLLTPFISEIARGEYSFVYINSLLSHCLLKKPALGEFISNFSFVPSRRLITPAPDLLNQAGQIYKKLNISPLYARLDLVNIKGKLKVMEIELIEPELFFKFNPESASLFAAAIDKLIR